MAGKLWKDAPNKAARVAAMLAGRTLVPFETRLWSKIDRSGGPNACWLWLTPSVRKGYGTIWKDGRLVYSHRIVWELANGPIPPGLVIDHLCRTPLCQNPKHMRVVTPKANAINNNTSPMAINAHRQHCPRGHPYNTVNTLVITPRRVKTARGHWRPGRPTRICAICYLLRCKDPRRSKHYKPAIRKFLVGGL